MFRDLYLRTSRCWCCH